MFFFKKKPLKHKYQQRDATNGYCEVLNMNLNIWFDIPSKYIENFCVIFSVAVGIFSERSQHILSGFFPSIFFGISLALVKTNVKNVFWRVFFPDLAWNFFLLFVFVPFACYMLGFVFKTESCPLCFNFLTGVCYA